MMADQQQHTETTDIVEQDSFTGYSHISDAPTKFNTSKESTPLAEVDPESVSNINCNASVNADSRSAAESKTVSIVEPNEEADGVDENIELALPEGEDQEDRLDVDIARADMQMGVGEKKKKNKKKKSKSQRGLVRLFHCLG